MAFLHSLAQAALSTNPKLQRLINYWAVTALLYVLCVCLLWFEVWVGEVPLSLAKWLSVAVIGGSVLFYCLIRFSLLLKLTPSQLAFGQGMQAIICIIAAYAIAQPVRGAVLTLLLVVLVFCAFALTPRRSYQISLCAIAMLGAVMWWLVANDPLGHPPEVEGVHFVLAASMMAVVVLLTGQFNSMRSRLKAQRSELEAKQLVLSEALASNLEIARRDDLTMLPNRRHMKELLTAEERRRFDDAKGMCIALLDIDHFKSINDIHGHSAGDQVLHDFAQYAQASLRTADVLARWGGEEFLLLLPNTDQQAAMQVLTRIQRKLTEAPLKAADTTLAVTFSAGIAAVTAGEPITDAIKRADRAMFRAKAAGRNTSLSYDPEMEATQLALDELKAALETGIRQNQLVLHYQPQVGANGKVTGAEALVRWQHPQRGLMYPGEFIPIAEESDMIVALGQWVLHAACAQLAAWSTSEETAHLSMSINISARQLRQPDFVAAVLAVLNSTGVNPALVKLELTESMLVDDAETAIAKMHALKAHALSFSLDDFGTGYSSLSYLMRLPIDQVKIDRSFVTDILQGPNHGVIARTVISLAQGMEFAVIAEGVETVAQRDFLILHGCNSFQGYLYSRPLPVEAFGAYLRAQNLALPPDVKPLLHRV